jgi:hypothetical protein
MSGQRSASGAVGSSRAVNEAAQEIRQRNRCRWTLVARAESFLTVELVAAPTRLTRLSQLVQARAAATISVRL